MDPVVLGALFVLMCWVVELVSVSLELGSGSILGVVSCKFMSSGF